MTLKPHWKTTDDYIRIIRVLKNASTFQHAAKVLNMASNKLARTTNFLRKHDVDIARFSKTKPTLDWDRIRAVAKATTQRQPDRRIPPHHKKYLAQEAFYLEFVKVYNNAKNADEVARRFSMPVGKVSRTAIYLRTKKVPLKNFKTRYTMNFPMLIEAALDILEKLSRAEPQLVPTRFKRVPFSK